MTSSDSTSNARMIRDAERQEKKIDLVERVNTMKDVGYPHKDIAEVLGISESAVVAILRGEMPARLAELEIGRLANQKGLTVDEAKAGVTAYLTEHYGLTTQESIHSFWASLSFIRKFDIIKKVLS